MAGLGAGALHGGVTVTLRRGWGAATAPGQPRGSFVLYPGDDELQLNKEMFVQIKSATLVGLVV